MLLALVALVALVWVLIAQPWRGSASERTAAPVASATPKQTATALPVPSAAGTPTPTASPTAKATPTPAPTTPRPSASTEPAAAACGASDVQVEALTDKDSYKSGQKPQFSIALINTGDDDCTINVGTSTQKFTVASGDEVYWRSTDCQSTPSDQVVLLAAGQRVVSAAPLVWDRTRSSVKTCTDSSRPKAPGGGASYHLSVSIGGFSSDGTKQFLLY